MQFDFKRLGVFIAALILYYLFSPLFGLAGIFGFAIASGLLVYLFTTRSFNKSLYKQVPSRDHREMGFYFSAAIAAFAGSDVVRFGLAILGIPMNFAGILGILAFFALILWLTYKVYPEQVAPRML